MQRDDSAATIDDVRTLEPVTVPPSCPEGRVWCGASCDDLQTSLGSCGYCNLHCGHNAHCSEGACVDDDERLTR